ncbi:MAG: hypothetical protein RIB98_18250 [Acidimicrobiales bacterium]
MKSRIWLVLVLLGAACAAPEPPDEWSVERLTPPPEETAEPVGVCDDIRELATGSHADETELDGTLAALARIAATTGATSALPLLSDIGDLGTATTTSSGELLSNGEVAVLRHDLLLTAGRAIDDATATACGIPAFSALYATSGFPECHFEMEIPIAAYVAPAAETRCTMEGRPTFLPCWSDDGDHLAVDCVTGKVVQAVDDRWSTAGDPRTIEIDRSATIDPDAPDIVALNPAPECADLATLFRTDAAASADLERLPASTASLSIDIRNQVAAFIAAAADPPSLDEFEALVFELDQSTAAACGLPLVSAWATLTDDAAVLPCWTETGLPYPAFEVIDCA